MKKSGFLWLIPAGLGVVAAAILLALPGYVAAQDHRPALERFASALTGRQVHIGGRLALRLLPRPELNATDITIAGPDAETVTARGLALDISLPALLRGQLAAQTLYLDSPVIKFPWPLPGGPKAVAPPPLLAALHAYLANASITLGPMQLTGVNADVQTSAGGTVSLSGNGTLLGLPVGLKGMLGPLALDGTALLSLDANSGPASAHFTGTLNGEGNAGGQLSLVLPQGITASAAILASADNVAASAIQARQGNASLSGTISFGASGLSATLLGQNLNLDEARSWPWALPPVSLALNASNVTLLGQNFPALVAAGGFNAGALKITALNLTLPGGATLAGQGAAAADGALSGQLRLVVPDSAALLAAYKLPALPNWPTARLSADLAGTLAQPVLRNFSGALGADHVQGNLIFGPGNAAGQLGFDHIALAPLAAWATQHPQGDFTADIALTAGRAEAGPVKLSNLALDAALDGTLNIRRVSANLYGGLAGGSFTLDASGKVSAAQGFVDIPSAAPLGALLPSAYALPPALLAQPFTLLLAARGPADALSAAAVAQLGQFTVTASPIINLVQGSASGAFSLQHPEAILVARYFGFDEGLAFPGAGSASLRARFTASATQYGLNDFVLSFGALNATGRIMAQNGVVSGRIDAGILPLPPIPANVQFPAALPLQGKLSFTAAQMLYAGNPLLGASAGNVSWSAGHAVLDVAPAQFGGGTLSGRLSVALSASAAPAFTAALQAQGINAASVALPISFPYPIIEGTLNASADLTAKGYGLKSVVATLGGSLSLNARDGVLRGFNLQGFGDALGAPDAAHMLSRALLTGSTSFSTLNLGATLAQGNCTLTSATLAGEAGQVSGSGGIDIYDNAQALRLILTPASVTPPVSATLLVLGTWAVPRHIAHMKAALAWKPALAPAP